MNIPVGPEGPVERSKNLDWGWKKVRLKRKILDGVEGRKDGTEGEVRARMRSEGGRGVRVYLRFNALQLFVRANYKSQAPRESIQPQSEPKREKLN